MKDKQPEALRIAALLEKTGAQGSLRDEAASELRRLHAELETLTLYKNLADEYGLSIFKDLKDLTTEIENLREKLKTYEDLGGAADDVQLLRMGYAAARLEVESLKAQLAERASHGQAPAQAVPAAVAWPVAVLKFERGTPGRENEMPRVVSCNWMPDGEYEVYLAAAPTTQPAPQREPAEIDTATMVLAESVGLIGPASRTHDLHGAIQRFHDLICANATIKAAEAISAAAPQPSPAAQGDALDAAVSTRWLTVVYRDVAAGDEAREIFKHPKASAMSWSHAMHERDAARAAQEDNSHDN